MKRLAFAFVLLALSAALFAQAGTQDISIPSLPSSAEEFVTMRDRVATSAHGGAAMLVVALLLYNQNPTLGLQCLTAILVNDIDHVHRTWRSDGYRGYTPSRPILDLLSSLEGREYIVNTYVEGTVVRGSYALPDAPLTIVATTSIYSPVDEDTIRVFIDCSGAAASRPVTVSLNENGIWKTEDFSELLVPVQIPPRADTL